MTFTNYLSYVTSPNRIDSHFQFKYTITETPLYGDSDLEMHLTMFYYDKLFNDKTDLSFCTEMLDYHYKKYKEGKERFLSFVSISIDEPIKLPIPLDLDGNYRWDCPDRFSRELVIREWIKSKYQELGENSLGAATSRKKTKLIKLNEYTKPLLTQVQIAILFRIMKDKRIFTRRDLDKTAYSEILAILTGYSKNTLRIAFSDSQPIITSDKPKDYNAIVDSLKQIIDEVEREKNEIGQI
jgi:hypothetical protein